MKFRLKNISTENHRVEFISPQNGHFWTGGEIGEMGDVSVSADGREWNGCLVGLKGPTINCADALPTIQVETTAFAGGKFYLNGIGYELSGDPGESFLDMYGKLVSDNPWFNDVLELSTLEGYPNVVVFTAMSAEHARVVIEAADGQPLEWSQVPSEHPVNETFGVDGNVVSFCLMPKWEVDLNYPSTLHTGNESYFNFTLYSNERLVLDESNCTLTALEGDVTITVSSQYENNSSWYITGNSEGTVTLELWCPYRVPSREIITMEVKQSPTLDLVIPTISEWNIKGYTTRIQDLEQKFSDGTTIRGTGVEYSLEAVTRYPPFYDHAVLFSNGTLTFNTIGSSKLTGRARHPDVGYINSTPIMLNVFTIPDDINLGYLIPGTKQTVRMELGNTPNLPEGWTTELVEDLTVPVEVHDMVNWSIDPNDPLNVIIKVTGGSFGSAIRLRMNYKGPDGITRKSTLIRFQLNTTYSGKQYIFMKYPNDDNSRKEIDIEGVVYGAKIGGTVTIKALDWEMDVIPVNTYTTTVDENGLYKFQLPENAFSPDARRPTVTLEVESWKGGTIKKTVYAAPRLPLIVKCERNIFLRTSEIGSTIAAMQAIVDDVQVVQPNSTGYIYPNLTSEKTDLATIKFYSENPSKGSVNSAVRFYRGETESTIIADVVNPSIREVVSFGAYSDNGKMGGVRFDSISGLVKVPANLPETWTSLQEMFTNCKDLNDPTIKQWDVSRIGRMDGTFKGCVAFTQDLSGWCVTKITSEPANFATGSGLTLKPVWGTCPNG